MPRYYWVPRDYRNASQILILETGRLFEEPLDGFRQEGTMWSTEVAGGAFLTFEWWSPATSVTTDTRRKELPISDMHQSWRNFIERVANNDSVTDGML